MSFRFSKSIRPRPRRIDSWPTSALEPEKTFLLLYSSTGFNRSAARLERRKTVRFSPFTRAATVSVPGISFPIESVWISPFFFGAFESAEVIVTTARGVTRP